MKYEIEVLLKKLILVLNLVAFYYRNAMGDCFEAYVIINQKTSKDSSKVKIKNTNDQNNDSSNNAMHH